MTTMTMSTRGEMKATSLAATTATTVKATSCPMMVKIRYQLLMKWHRIPKRNVAAWICLSRARLQSYDNNKELRWIHWWGHWILVGSIKNNVSKFSSILQKGEAEFWYPCFQVHIEDGPEKDVVRKFSQRARSCMLTYKSLELEDTNTNIETKNETKKSHHPHQNWKCEEGSWFW